MVDLPYSSTQGGVSRTASRSPERSVVTVTTPRQDAATRVWLTSDDCDLATFRSLVERTTDAADYPPADGVADGVLVYGDTLRERASTAAGRRAVQAEIARALTH